jgi:hypothetical protein
VKLLRLIVILGLATAFFLEGMATMYYLDNQHIKRIDATMQENMLYLAAPLLECRAGREWQGIEIWKAERPGCDFDCALHLLLLQAEADAAEKTVAEGR